MGRFRQSFIWGNLNDIVISVVDEGDEVLLLDPCYETYGSCIALAGGTPVSQTNLFANFKILPDFRSSKQLKLLTIWPLLGVCANGASVLECKHRDS
jgi:hypothetical protein